MRSINFTAEEEHNGKKIYFLLKSDMGVSSRLVRTLKHTDDGILLNGERARTVDTVKPGDIVTINIPDDTSRSALPVDYPLDVIYEDSDILVINKPAGLAMHESHNHQNDTLANAVSGYLLSKGEPCVFRAVGRLDKDTSGVVICAKHIMAASKLSGKIKKQYLAIVQGELTGDGSIDVRIYRPDPMKTLRAAGDFGEEALTNWVSLKSNGEYSLIKVTPLTGRTHQIRVHLSYIGHPLAGDEMYGGRRLLINRHALHCEKVVFNHPVTGEEITFTAQLPADMCTLADGI